MQSSRRAFVTGLASALFAGQSLARIEPEPSEFEPEAPNTGFTTYDLNLDGPGPMAARVYVPHALAAERNWPVAILLHGYAQALVNERALAAWGVEYDALEAYTRLERGHVVATRELGHERTLQITRELEATPFRGMVLVAPVTPIPYFQRHLGHMLGRYSEWIHHELLPRVAEVAPISSDPERIGLAGVSMGGLVALELMWRFPEQFGAFCGVQIAIKRAQVYNYASLLERAFSDIQHGHGRPIHVVTATLDKYRQSNQALYKALLKRRLDVSLQLREGAHTARWMRQAGSLESLLWLDRILNQPEHQAAGGSTSTSGALEPSQQP